MSHITIKNSLNLLQAELKRVKYLKPVAYGEISQGLCEPLLPIMHFALLDYSAAIAGKIVSSGIILTVANDEKFVELMYKVARKILEINTLSLTPKQFLQKGFSAEHKIGICLKILKAVQEKAAAHSGSTPLKNRLSNRSSIKDPKYTESPKVGEPFSDNGKEEVPSVARRLNIAIERLDRASLKIERLSSTLEKLIDKSERFQHADSASIENYCLLAEDVPKVTRPSPMALPIR